MLYFILFLEHNYLSCINRFFKYFALTAVALMYFHCIFQSDLTENILSNKLRTTLKRIRENLMSEQDAVETYDNRNKVRIYVTFHIDCFE